ncbi:AraC family transcriptional regulator [Ferruginibacter sp. SUN106]|uniref:AraC family transcriptional regulator n=1 Tax=Ferruginibacter sp. SUN106 TaxID=2978348 RepID=UPI003D3607CA
MKFITFIPSPVLTPYIKTFAISESEEEKTYKVLPDTGLVIGFQYKGKLSHISNEQQIELSKSGLTGLHDSYRVFKNVADTGTVLVYFNEGGANKFFKQPIHELFRESISLDNFMLRSELLLIEEQLYAAATDDKKIKVVEDFLISRMRPVAQDNLVLTALALIHKSKGNIKIKDLLAQLHISQSPLEKRFRQVVGTSPKKFAGIIRFKHTIKNYNPQNSLTNLGYEAGFYDQAHFIKEFKQFTGETPEAFFSPE